MLLLLLRPNGVTTAPTTLPLPSGAPRFRSVTSNFVSKSVSPEYLMRKVVNGG